MFSVLTVSIASAQVTLRPVDFEEVKHRYGIEMTDSSVTMSEPLSRELIIGWVETPAFRPNFWPNGNSMVARPTAEFLSSDPIPYWYKELLYDPTLLSIDFNKGARSHMNANKLRFNSELHLDAEELQRANKVE